jgi:hypothetical protein
MKRILFSLITILLIIIGTSGCGSDKENLVNSALEKTLTILPGSTGGSGTVNPTYGSHAYKYHEHVIVTANPQPNSLFGGWQGIEGIMSKMSAVDPSRPSSWLDEKIDVVMEHDITLTALFYPAYNLTININGAGTVKVAKVEGLGGFDTSRFTGDIINDYSARHVYCGGQYVTFTVSQDTSYSTFTGWTWTGDMRQVDPQQLPLNLSVPSTGSLLMPLNPMSREVTVYMNQDVKLTANFLSR